MKKKNGFTLIELLAVIIILGILMIIAVPAVNKYINDSRKTSYVDIAKNLANGARNLLHSGDFNLNDTNTTYYIDGNCIKTDNSFKSPYGDFERAYVVVTVTEDGNSHEYYWTSVDSTGTGVKSLIRIDKLDSANIEEGLTTGDITTNRGIDERSNIVVIEGEQCTKGNSVPAEKQIDGNTGKLIRKTCIKAETLHTAKCQRNPYGCSSVYGNGNTITYGTIPGSIKILGNAYDCDVNADGEYDSETERFYYIKSEGDNSILIYYTNYNDPTNYTYNPSNTNRSGPINAYQYLPSTNEWSNTKLIPPGTRQIKNELGTVVTNFSYTGRAARFLTYQDIESVVSGTLIAEGSLDNYSFLFENLGYYTLNNIGTSAYWIETPHSTDSREVYTMHAHQRKLNQTYYANSTSVGIRPVITLKTSDVE